MKRKFRLRLQPKLLIATVLMGIIIAAAMTYTFTVLFGVLIEEFHSQVTYAQACIAANTIDGDRIKDYYNDGVIGEKDDYYQEISDYLSNVQDEMALIYFRVVIPDGNEMVCVWDTGTLDGDDALQVGERISCTQETADAMKKAFAADAERTTVPAEDMYSTYAAVLDSSGKPVALAVMGITMNRLYVITAKFMLIAFVVTAVVILLTSIMYYFFVRRILVRPLKKLHGAVGSLVSDDMEKIKEFNVNIKSKDELGDLADAFRHMVQQLNEHIDNITRMTAEKERIGAELDVATHIQKSMLPCDFPAFPERSEIDIYATMDPAKEVGGDFYDFFMVDERHLAIVVADVSGKGVPAALFMVIGKTLIKDHTESGSDLGKVFAEVNDLLCESNSEGLFITAFEGVLDLVTGDLDFVNAGHEMPFICRAGEEYKPHKLKAGFVLAGMEGIKYRAGRITLAPGDKIFQYTDGVTEATNGANELYGMERLEKALNTDVSRTPSQLLPEIKADIDRFVGDAPQFDDITMLCLEYKCRMEDNDARTDN